MKRYLLDTGIIGHFIDHRHGVDLRVCEARQLGARIGTCFPVIGELFAGVELSASREKNLPRLRRALTQLICWPFDRAAAEEFGRVFAELAAPVDRCSWSICRSPPSLAAWAIALSSVPTATWRTYPAWWSRIGPASE